MEAIAAKVIGVIVTTIVIVLAIPALFGREARMRRKLRAADQRAIRDLAEATPARRRVAGMVVPLGEPLLAPLSGRPCVYYETRVIRRIGIATTWCDFDFEIAYEKRSAPFVLDDATGTALIDATHAELLMVADDTDPDPDERDRERARAANDAFLARFNRRRRGLVFEKRLCFTETIVAVGERIAVVGTAQHDRDPTTAPADPYRHHAEPAQPGFAGTSASPLLITNDPKLTPPLDDAYDA